MTILRWLRRLVVVLVLLALSGCCMNVLDSDGLPITMGNGHPWPGSTLQAFLREEALASRK